MSMMFEDIPDEAVSFVLPSMKISGGVLESIRFAQDLKRERIGVDVLSMWTSKNSVDEDVFKPIILSKWKTSLIFAPVQLFGIILLFFLHSRRCGRTTWVFTHYSTLPLALVVPRQQRFVFVQDLEWNFIRNIWLSFFLKKIVCYVYRRSTLLAANPYLFQALKHAGLTPSSLVPIWADPFFGEGPAIERDIDVMMVLRKGWAKRLDLYLEALSVFKSQAPKLKLAVVTTEDEIDLATRELVSLCSVRPNRAVMRSLYSRSKIFLLLSDHEGFGLPPLEAMGSGCVPFCRDAGGPRAYMVGALESCLVSRDESIESICNQVISLIQNAVDLAHLSMVALEIFWEGSKRTQFCRESLKSIFFER